ASRTIPAYTLLEISPALLFSSEEYEAHGKHTVLDHHSFRWKDGKMALRPRSRCAWLLSL
ncbi:hypothetical protein EDB89DRAFT_1862566, partial [Lactarius sanguifluus]